MNKYCLRGWKLTAIPYADRMQDEAHVQAQGKHAQAGAGHVRRLARACRCRARAHLGFVSTDGFVLQDKQHSKSCASIEASGQRYLACCYHCRSSASTELATREIRPSTMVKKSPHEHTVVRGGTCLDEERGSRRRLRARIQGPWSRLWPGVPPFSAASRNSSFPV